MATNLYLPKSILDAIKPKLPLSRVELHVHLDGSMRQETLFELLKVKGLPCPGDGTFQDFKGTLEVQSPKDLQHFLTAFSHFMPAIQGDLKAIKRIAVEFCEDVANNGVLYVEARFCPHLMLDEKHPEIGARQVLKAVLEGFAEGESLHGIKARAILCCINGLPQFSQEILALCDEFRNDGVVGIDIAGNENAIANSGGSELYNDFDKSIFREAKQLGIHRTVHAGEDGPATNVKVAIEEMFAERIGHGYRVMQDPELYEKCIHDYNIHFEACPSSSILTGSVQMANAVLLKHPILQFAHDNANFSINTDDTTILGTGLDHEYQILRTWGLNEVHFVRATMNAARSCFLPQGEKSELLKKLKSIYGLLD